MKWACVLYVIIKALCNCGTSQRLHQQAVGPLKDDTTTSVDTHLTETGTKLQHLQSAAAAVAAAVA